MALGVALFAMINGCRHEILYPGNGSNTGGGGGNNGGAGSNCSPDTAYFVNDIMPLISSNCAMSGCHDNITHADGVRLTTYNQIQNYVTPGDASNSELYKIIIKTNGDRMPPPPMPPLTASQKALIKKWIDQGARNNGCLAGCDTSQYTFAGAVKPIMDNKCAGCHNPANTGGGVELSTYTGVKAAALTGTLYGSVSHQPGYAPMPQNAPKLSDCEITQIQKWIMAGTLNN